MSGVSGLWSTRDLRSVLTSEFSWHTSGYGPILKYPVNSSLRSVVLLVSWPHFCRVLPHVGLP